ncbi:MAG: YbaB/EbfC family nucleoid-associated protein [Deltaproteobacteria bacterium]|jgi:DNA-binding YbaB/EbfC family protein|nr:YbaB/EbfC family nucleoid-associated protein [Deltaproteobacteria bacterium]
MENDERDNLIRSAKVMEDQMMNFLSENKHKTEEASAGGGMVKAVVNWNYHLVSLEIEKEVVNPDEMEMLSELIMAAVNEALAQVKNSLSKELAKLSSRAFHQL